MQSAYRRTAVASGTPASRNGRIPLRSATDQANARTRPPTLQFSNTTHSTAKIVPSTLF